MKLSELTKELNKLVDSYNSSLQGLDPEVYVRVCSPGSIGPTPAVMVKSLFAGFDWDHGRLILETDHQLTRLSEQEVADIHKSAKDGQSWHAFQSHKRQAETIRRLEDELEMLEKTR